MAESDVFDVGGEGGWGEFFAVSDHDGAFGISASESGLDGAVSHGEDACVGMAVGFEAQGFLGGGQIECGDAFDVGVGGLVQVGEVGDAEEGDGEDECLDGAGFVGEGDDEFFESNPAVFIAIDGSNDVGVGDAEEVGGGFETTGGIVVSCGENDLEVWEGFVRGVDEGEEGALCVGAGIDGVEDVARDEEGVRAVLLDEREEVVEECGVFLVAIEAVEGLAEVPVSGVKDAHG